MTSKIHILFYLIILLINTTNAGPISCGVGSTSCCSGQSCWIALMIPPCVITCGVHCIPVPIPPVITPVDLGAICQLAGMAAALLPTP